MGLVPVAPRALALPWLRPTATGLLALTDAPPTRAAILDCPGTLLHVLRYARPTPDADQFVLSEDLLSQPQLCSTAAGFLALPQGWGADWTRTPVAEPLLRFGRAAAQLAGRFAGETGLCSPDAAFAVGLLAPLGGYAQLESCDSQQVARRLAYRWRLPTQFAVTLGYLSLSPDDAVQLGGHVGLHRVVRAAVAIAQQRLGTGVLHVGNWSDPDLESLALTWAEPSAIPQSPACEETVSPSILARLLRATASARYRNGAALVADLEVQIDRLAAQLGEARGSFDSALHEAKLSALAEFAAGASHEINNPLAVISGNAQLLLDEEDDNADRQRRLAAVMRAVRRIADILVAARTFARPPQPHPGVRPLVELLDRELAHHRPAADERGIQLECAIPADSTLTIRADADQVQQAIGHLVRNALEAAANGGWVRIRADRIDDRIDLSIEDSGPGPTPSSVPHLFDPFFSGRSAGRGRGLGLSVAWQLARQNGGSVEYVPQHGGPTRFTLTLPAETHHRPSDSDLSESAHSKRCA